jgi:hypothetical protein
MRGLGDSHKGLPKVKWNRESFENKQNDPLQNGEFFPKKIVDLLCKGTTTLYSKASINITN